ncbi:MAG: tetratricopeptide repeat protein [Verrucomicrobiota bacterium]|jgi:predicted Zn-dependent protease
MKSFLAATALLISLIPPARAQQDADEKYIAIYGAVQQAESLAETGESKQALASLTDAQSQLQQFQKIYPDWNPAIVSYRLDDLAKKIADINAKLAAAAAVPPPAQPSTAASAGPPKLSPEEQNLRAQLLAAQAENDALQAKLKEALASQPAVIDSGELARAQEQIRSLMKENDLLKANATVEKNTNGISALRRKLSEALDKYTAEQARSQKLIADNAALQRDLKRAGGHDEGTVDLLRSQNDRLKSQLTALQAAANDATAAGELAAKLRAANTQINSLQSAVTVVTLEKGALENKVKQLAAEVDQLRAANYEGRLRDLAEQRDELAKELAGAGKKSSRRNADAQLAGLTNEMQTLRARLAVAEAKPVPYSTEELALFNQAPPQPAVAHRSIRELPPGAAELVASAQRHFANHEFDAAEADYQKILEHDQNNGLVLANLATIELQENKLAGAEKHITAAVAESPDDAYNLSTLGYLRFRQEKYDDALDALSRAAKIDPNNPEIQNYLGVTLSHKGLRVQAETALRRAVQINPLYAPAHNNLAVVYLNQTPPMPQLARWHYQKAIAAGQPRNPDLERLLANKGAPVDAQ